MGYNLWLATEEQIAAYYSRRVEGRHIDYQMRIGDDPLVYPISLRIDRVLKDDFTLDEIDSFVCRFKNLAALRKEFSKHSGYKEIADRKGELIIARKTNNIDKYKVIYNNPFLAKHAMIIREKRRRGEKEFLDRTPEIEEFAKRMVKYASSEKTSQMLISSDLIPPHVRDAFVRYNENIKRRRFDKADNCFENIFSFCLNYRTLRGFVVWEQEYLDMKKKERAIRAAANKQAREEKQAVYNMMSYEKELQHARPYDSPVLEEIDGLRDENGNIDYDNVYSLFDLDDIHSHSKEALQSVGLLPVDEVPKDIVEQKGAKKK